MKNEKRKEKKEKSKTTKLRAASKYSATLWLFFIFLSSFFFLFTACNDPNDNDNENNSTQIYPHGLAYATPAKSQDGLGICWLFAANAVLETHIKKITGTQVNLSENHARQAIFGSNRLGLNSEPTGGSAALMMSYWLRGEFGGPVLTQNDYPYNSDLNFTAWNQDASRYGRVTNFQSIPDSTLTPLQDNAGNDPVFRNSIKNAISQFGSVSASCWSNASYLRNSPDGISYYHNRPDESNYLSNAEDRTNHIIQILGWNDDYSAAKFSDPPPGNGAWYVKNSTTGAGEHYHWISYYQYFRNISFIAGYESTPKGNVYDYTPITTLLSSLTAGDANPRYLANIFDCEDEDAYLEEIIIRVTGNAMYTIYATTDEFTQDAAEDHILLNSSFSNKVANLRISEDELVNKYTGFYTLKLDTPIPVGQKSFAIVVECSTLDSTPLSYYYVRTSLNPNIKSNARESYFSSSTSANKSWNDFHLRHETQYGNFYIYGVVTGSSGQSDRRRVMDR